MSAPNCLSCCLGARAEDACGNLAPGNLAWPAQDRYGVDGDLAKQRDCTEEMIEETDHLLAEGNRRRPPFEPRGRQFARLREVFEDRLVLGLEDQPRRAPPPPGPPQQQCPDVIERRHRAQIPAATGIERIPGNLRAKPRQAWPEGYQVPRTAELDTGSSVGSRHLPYLGRVWHRDGGFRHGERSLTGSV
jgi:hypothetical protein